MKRITKFQKSDKLATKLTAVKTIAMLGKGFSKRYTEILIRQAYMKGHKAGMDRQRQINLNKEFFRRMNLINERIAKAMG